MRTVLILILAGLLAPLAAGCGGTRAAGVDVVAAESLYGNIAAQIGGGRVHVTSILSDPNADPHLFEPGTASGLAVARARLVISNGLGYDAFIDRLLSASPSGGRITVSIAKALGREGNGANPHLWYDVPALPRIAAAIAAGLRRADPLHAAAYERGLARFDRSLGPLRQTVAALRRRHGGEPVASTEPVPGYLVAAAGLRDLAPDGFARAIEQGTEPTPRAVAAMLRLVRDRRVRALLYNSQAVSSITSRIRTAARAAGIPVVAVTETLPSGLTFQRWQRGQAEALLRALERAPAAAGG